MTLRIVRKKYEDVKFFTRKYHNFLSQYSRTIRKYNPTNYKGVSHKYIISNKCGLSGKLFVYILESKSSCAARMETIYPETAEIPTITNFPQYCEYTEYNNYLNKIFTSESPESKKNA